MSPSPIKAKNGSSLFKATLSLVKEIEIVSLSSNYNKSSGVVLKEGDTIGKFSYNEIWSIFNGSELLYVRPDPHLPTLSAWATASSNGLVTQLLRSRLPRGRLLFHWSVKTDSVDAIRALAKEIRADKSVAKVTKKPAKPKANLKTRRDVI